MSLLTKLRGTEREPLLASNSSSAIYSPLPQLTGLTRVHESNVNLSHESSTSSSGSGCSSRSTSGDTDLEGGSTSSDFTRRNRGLFDNNNLLNQPQPSCSTTEKGKGAKGVEGNGMVPISAVEVHKKTTNTATMMHLLKGNIGTGILAMPSAFAHAGLWVGTLGIPVMGVIAVHCMHILINCQVKLCERFNVTFLDYEEVAEKAVEAGPLCFHRFGKAIRTAVSVFLMITQLGFCCVYGLFVAENIRMVVEGFTKKPTFDVIYYMILILPFMITLNMVRSLKHLAIASTCANLLQTLGMLIIFWNLLQDLPATSSRPASVDISLLPLYFGTAIYAFEGIGIVLPIKKEMQEPKAFGGAVGVLNTGMVIVACLYTGMGFFGYLKYGEGVAGSITLNLPQNALNEVCRLMFALAIFLSYALQMYVPIQLLWPWFLNTFQMDSESRKARLWEMVLRAVMVTATFLLAAAVPKLDLFISLVGALSSSCLALIFPPLIDLATGWDEKGSKSDRARTLWYAKNFGICIFGVLGFVTGTFASMKDIVEFFAGDKLQKV